MRNGEAAEAVPLVKEALDAHRAEGRHAQMLNASNLLSHAHKGLGQLAESAKVLKDAVGACRERDGSGASSTVPWP